MILSFAVLMRAFSTRVATLDIFAYRANGLCLIAFHTDDLVQDKERNALRIW